MKRIFIVVILPIIFAYFIIEKTGILEYMKKSDLHDEDFMIYDDDSIYVYTKPNCPYCVNAKLLLKQKSVAFKEIDISSNQQLHEKLKQETFQNTVPYIFIYGQFIGGYLQLQDLDNTKKLDELLAQK
ncbi:glutaredoxin family protein [Orientia chuto str. Dubai]|uniref:Glutaredoxin 1 n=1 Tax=Orientia chuto str. Dubai TaxID=1359168 RepID=A0A0F3MSJ5_9RICK|nr:glutaredoxin domain-containing protein [Candidatus Orientia mediorientalis]KJV57554.1 glutaredoxin family protein [Orientia chuto str. Dubai]